MNVVGGANSNMVFFPGGKDLEILFTISQDLRGCAPWKQKCEYALCVRAQRFGRQGTEKTVLPFDWSKCHDEDFSAYTYISKQLTGNSETPIVRGITCISSAV